MREYRDAVYIGRFQPFHNGHMAVVKRGLEIADTLTIIVGSAAAAPNIKNPFSFEARKAMILQSILEEIGTVETNLRVRVVGVRDYFYNENYWIANVQAEAARLGVEDGVLLGNWKDASSYYLKLFPQWEFQAVDAPQLHATDIRTLLFREQITTDWEGKPVFNEKRAEVLDRVRGLVPNGVFEEIMTWVTTPAFANLAKEWHYLEKYKASWDSAPFPPMFITTDAIVTCSGHVLVVRRKHNPGKGLYALPGGFLKPSEFIMDGMLRELREETKIKIDKQILRASVVAEKVFDHPERSLRGRTVTHGFHIKLKDGNLPEVKGDDDASVALWMPLMDVQQNEREFFEDHAHIINYFIAQ